MQVCAQARRIECEIVIILVSIVWRGISDAGNQHVRTIFPGRERHSSNIPIMLIGAAIGDAEVGIRFYNFLIDEFTGNGNRYVDVYRIST